MPVSTLERSTSEKSSDSFERIVFNRNIHGGKPIIRDTRVTVESILELLAQEGDFHLIVRSNPSLTEDDVRDAVRFAAASLKNDIYLSADLP